LSRPPRDRPGRRFHRPSARSFAALSAIDRPLAADGDAALTYAVEICFEKYDGKPDQALESYAQAAYTVGGAATISSAAAHKIVTAAKKWICPIDALVRRWES
jgi:hypothetical protein